jgi:sulfofructose kinase
VRIPFVIPDAAGKAHDVVGLGQNSIDFIAVVPAHPARDTKVPIDTFTVQPGGQIATALAVCSRLGWRTRYVGVFGDDEGGRLSRQSLVAEGVDVGGAMTVAGTKNRLAFILVDGATGERSILWYRDPALRADDFQKTAVTESTAGRLLIVDGEDIGTATRAAAAARRVGIPTIVDVDELQPGIHELLGEIDAVIAAEEFPTALTGHPQLGRALEMIEREYHAPLVCVTLGAKGSLTRCGGQEIRTPAVPVKCVDSTGAGDVFRGAFAAGCLRWPEGDLERVLAYASHAAALSCRAIGARGSLPVPQELEEGLSDTGG